MELEKIKEIEGRAVYLTEDNINTDQTAPTDEALYVLSWPELADVFLILERKDEQGVLKQDHILNNPAYDGARILFVRKNFNCGSSREHAAQATKARYDAVVGESFAPIFEDNAYAIGLPVVKTDEQGVDLLIKAARENPQTQFRLNLECRTISWDNGLVRVEMDENRRKGFLEGIWDERKALVSNMRSVHRLAAASPYVQRYTNLM